MQKRQNVLFSLMLMAFINYNGIRKYFFLLNYFNYNENYVLCAGYMLQQKYCMGNLNSNRPKLKIGNFLVFMCFSATSRAGHYFHCSSVEYPISTKIELFCVSQAFVYKCLANYLLWTRLQSRRLFACAEIFCRLQVCLNFFPLFP